MTKYIIYITREQHLKLEIDADSPGKADSQAWDAIDDATLLEEPTEIDYIQNEETRESYTFDMRAGKYKRVK